MTAMPFQTYVINLDRSRRRLAEMDARCAAAGLSYQRIRAVDGRVLSADQKAAYDREAGLAWYGFPMIDNEVACYLSHLLALRAFADSGADFGLVLEDDVEVTERSARQITAITALLVDRQIPFSLIQTHHNVRSPSSKIAALSGPDGRLTLYRAHTLAYCTGALLWSRAGAQRFLSECSRIRVPIDVEISRWAALHQDVLIGSQVLIRQLHAESEIDDGQPDRRSAPLADYPDFRRKNIWRKRRELQVANLARILTQMRLFPLVWPKLGERLRRYL